MPTLHVRNIPEDLHTHVRRLAAAESRSLSAQVVTLLAWAVEHDELRREQRALLQGIAQRRQRRRLAPGTPDSTRLLRADRDR